MRKEQIGPVTIYEGDCLDILLEIEYADAVITDPPYNVGLAYSDGDKMIDYKEWCTAWFGMCKDTSPLVILTPGMVNLHQWMVMEKPYWVCAWYKSNQLSPSAMGGFNVWEPILVYGKPKKRVGHDAWNYCITEQKDTGDHPCPKFLPFWRHMIVELTRDGDTILDPFLGSGTTAVACIQTGRKCIGIEKDARYFDLCCKRVENANMQKSLFAEDKL